MGWTVLYIAFGLVALWLLGEVLFQYKAPLHWRLLAFTGFLGVVAGVIVPSVILIAVGAVAFAVGQTYVTLSFRSGYVSGWSLGGRRGKSGQAPGGTGEPGQPAGSGRPGRLSKSGKPGKSGKASGGSSGENRRRKGRGAGKGASSRSALQTSGSDAAPAAVPDAVPAGQQGEAPYAEGPEATATREHDGIQDSNGFPGPNGFPDADGFPAAGGYPAGDGFAHAQEGFPGREDFSGPQDRTAVYAPQPLPEESGRYGVYDADARTPQDAPQDRSVYDGGGYGGAYADGYGEGYGRTAPGQDGYGDHYGAYGDGQGQGHTHGGEQTPYPDPYTGAQQYSGPYDPYEQHDPYGSASYAPHPAQSAQPAQQYGGEHIQHGQEPQGYTETPPGGVWVPQQRHTGLPPEQQPYPPYQQRGFDEQQYRY
ncbi:hypothetical protein [Streptomyces sp. MST-110588]|uniref:hypothetical protein n=1 Tax=Streptomyces sp. MST-110588 TaxID=2833628 RepID=UPI001F5CF5C7|nr:hypothetical protein [Streptomyces sp. MST-110588]UNO42566.1 hypothetical protein KGS77_27340 [Streptomyces sp. MST-110588]